MEGFEICGRGGGGGGVIKILKSAQLESMILNGKGSNWLWPSWVLACFVIFNWSMQ